MIAYLIVFLLIVGAIIFVSTGFGDFFKYSVQVEPRIQWVVIRNLNGEIDALGEGTHYLQPSWKEVDRVPTSIQRSTETGEEVRTQNSVRLALDEQLNFVAGHRMTPIQDNNVDTDWFEVDPVVIDKEMVIRASTSIDPGKPTQVASIREQVKLAVDAACEQVLGFYNDEQLFSPSNQPTPVLVPTIAIPGMAPRTVNSVSELYEALSEYIRRVTNRSLARIGIGLTSITITNLRYFDPKLQEAAEAKRRKVMFAQTAIAAKDALPDRGQGMSTQELLLVGDERFADVAAAIAEADGRVASARAFKDGMVSIANAMGGGALKGIVSISTAPANPQNPPPTTP